MYFSIYLSIKVKFKFSVMYISTPIPHKSFIHRTTLCEISFHLGKLSCHRTILVPLEVDGKFWTPIGCVAILCKFALKGHLRNISVKFGSYHLSTIIVGLHLL